MGDERSSGSNAGIVILIALLVLAVPCCGGAALLGLGVFSFRSVAEPMQPVDVQMAPPMMVEEERIDLQPIQEGTLVQPTDMPPTESPK